MSNPRLPTGPGKLSSQIFRVLAVPEPLRDAIRRRKEGQTLLAFMENAIDDILPDLVNTLKEALPNPNPALPTRPMRLPLNERLLALKSASLELDLPVTRILTALLSLATSKEEPRRRGGRRKKAAVAPNEGSAVEPTAPTAEPTAERVEAPKRGRRKGGVKKRQTKGEAETTSERAVGNGGTKDSSGAIDP